MITHKHCLETARRAEDAIDRLLIDEPGVHWMAFRYVDCCRKLGRFDLATQILDRLETLSQPICAEIRRGIEVHRAAIATRNSEFVLQDGTNNPGFTDEVATPPIPSATPPNWVIRGLNFTVAMARWAGTGFKTRTAEEIASLLDICAGRNGHPPCSQYVDGVCVKCGCNCNDSGLISKLALKGQSCPLGKW